MSEFVRPLVAPGPLGLCGGKALHLGRLAAAGFPVPEGVVLTTRAYQRFVEAHGLGPVIEGAWARMCEAPETVSAHSEAIRAAFESAPIPPNLVEAINAPCAQWLEAGEPLAVRSSATAEDLADASFAGQQDTFLNVRGTDGLLDAVRRCWASLWTARAVAYRRRQGINPAQVALAVVIQRMVPATAAGVMFTAHPTSGDRELVLIDAAWGLGEALVSGRVDPDQLIVQKRDGRVLHANIGDKAVQTVPRGSRGGTVDRAVEPGRQETLALSDSQVATLINLGRRIEDLFEAPQDIEWALVDNEVALLQSRAITTIPGDDAWPPLARGEPQPFDFWTQQDMGERWPDPVTPLTWAIFEPMNQALMDGMVAGLNTPWAGRIRWTRRAWGRVFMNEGALLHAYTHGFGMPLSMMASGLTHPGAAPEGADTWQIARVLKSLPFYLRVATTWEKDVTKLESMFPQVDAWVDAFMERDLSSLSDAEMLAEARESWYPRCLDLIRLHTSSTSLALGAYTQMEDRMEAWLADRSLAQDLVCGLTGIIAAEMVPQHAQLVAHLREAGLDALVREDPAGSLERLRAHPSAKPFLEALDAYLRRHGHRCMVEAELLLPRWAEDPSLVMEQLAAALELPANGPSGEQAVEARKRATDQIESELGWLQRLQFRRQLERLHHFTRMRDNGQHYAVKLLLPLRRLYAEIGRRWARRGWLRSPEDVFFLVAEDLDHGVGGGDPAVLSERADRRRVAWSHWCAGEAPEALNSTGLPVEPEDRLSDDELVGVAASRGVVTGVARVVANPKEALHINPGEILVTRATDPGWTPVFSRIGGAVIEIGGMLSHGAIVAREYGLPAVISVPRATLRIPDGAHIMVDGNTGRVTVLPTPSASPTTAE